VLFPGQIENGMFRKVICKKGIYNFHPEIKEDYMDPNLVENTKTS
jgi:hypothetical protein